MGPSVRPGFLVAIIGLQFVAASMEVNSRKFEPMVAFICNKPAMHRVPSGWVADDDSSKSCVKEPEEILKYCKKLYPDHDITNVLQATFKVTIPNWCGFNVTHCHKHGNHSVRPFRCLVGPFQSEALLVPEHCIFDHYHDPRVCNEFDQCNETAMSKCSARGMTTQSFAMLWPCQEPGHFSGVEFVCCPKVSLIPEQAPEPEKSTEAPKSSPPTAGKSENGLDDYTAYLKGDSKYLSKYSNEHERFKAAEKIMQKYQHERDTKMMKDWKAARNSVLEKKKTDPKKALELNKELTERYQRIYRAYEQESIAEKKQLVNTHQQHIQSWLNNRKQVLMKKLQDALLAKSPKKSKIEKAATAYIKVEEKDKMHTYNHFQHLRDTDPEDATNIQDRVIEHLNLIDDRISRVLEWLKRDPEIEKQVRPNIDKFMAKYKDINANSMKLLLRQEPTPKETPVETQKSEDYSEEDEAAVTGTADKVKPTEARPEQQEDIKVPGFDSETFEDERPANMEQTIHDLPNHHKKEYIAHIQHQPLIADDVSLDNLYANSHANSVLGIAIGGVAVFIIIVVAVVMLKKRTQRQRVTHGFVEVDPAASPEERHVANMQMNGYENPTYKYFEMQNQ